MGRDADYPAAHSMDTTWFAVDRDGHVACLQSWESGSVPEAAGHEPGEGARLLEEFGAASELRTEVVYALDGMLIPGLQPGGEHLWTADNAASDPRDILMFLASLDPVREELASGLAVPLPSRGVAAVRFKVLTRAISARLHESGACLSCFTPLLVMKEDQSPAALGFYSYSHFSLVENWLSGPYGLLLRPRAPIRVEQLPPPLRAAAERVRFDGIRFEETPRLQPVDFARCQSWEFAYLDADGTTIRGIPGREDGYRTVYEGYVKRESGLRVEPPPPREPPKPREDPREARRRLRAERADAPRRPAARPTRYLAPDDDLDKKPLTYDEALERVIAEAEVKIGDDDDAELTDSVAQLIEDGLSPAPDVMAGFIDALEVVARATEGEDEMRMDLAIALITLVNLHRHLGEAAGPDARWRPGLVEVEMTRVVALVNKIAGIVPDEPSSPGG
jgi:hypothetical protein